MLYHPYCRGIKSKVDKRENWKNCMIALNPSSSILEDQLLSQPAIHALSTWPTLMRRPYQSPSLTLDFHRSLAPLPRECLASPQKTVILFPSLKGHYLMFVVIGFVFRKSPAKILDKTARSPTLTPTFSNSPKRSLFRSIKIPESPRFSRFGKQVQRNRILELKYVLV